MVQIGNTPALSRRKFLTGCSACAMCLRSSATASVIEPAPGGKPKIRLAFTHPDPKIQGWPYQGFDYEKRKTELTARFRKECPSVEFLPATPTNADAARKMLAEDGDLDGQVVYLLGIPADASAPLVFSGRRTILVDDLYGGTGSFLALYSTAKGKNLPVAGVSSTDFGEVAQSVRALECIKRLQSSVLLDVLDRHLAPWEEDIRNSVGPQIRSITATELNAAYDGADRAEARKWAKSWIDNAEKVVEPSREEIERSGQMYVGMRKLLQEHGAQGIAIDCLRLFYGGKLPAYPCMGFFQLNNDGLVGACEADVQSAVTMLMLTYLVGKPGYISDPVIDTSKNQLIYAHCVAPNKVFGPSGPANKYHIRTHSEDRKGAAVRSFMPLGQMTTTMKIIPQEKTVVLHRGRTVANIDEDKACRTKLAVEVKDARKLAEEWKWGWHRVTVYGDVKVAVQNLCALAGLKLVEEG